MKKKWACRIMCTLKRTISFSHDSWLIFTKRFYTLKNYEKNFYFLPRNQVISRFADKVCEQKDTIFKGSNLFIRGGKLSSSSDKEMKKYAKMVFLWTDDEKQKKKHSRCSKPKEIWEVLCTILARHHYLLLGLDTHFTPGTQNQSLVAGQ